MTLEFNKLVEQVAAMGRMLDEVDFNIHDKLAVAMERLYAATDLDAIHERIKLVRQSDVSGYRGAAAFDEVIGQPFAPALTPATATIIAGDGSQIYPNEESPAHYFLLNVGLFTYHHGVDRLPDQRTIPRLYYHKAHVHDRGRVISNRTVDARRSVMEMQELGRAAWETRDEARPLIALYDNRLLFSVGSDVTDSHEIMHGYFGALTHLYDSQAILAGYLDNPRRSRVVIRLLYLLSLTDEQVRMTDLTTGGDLEGLHDVDLFAAVLEPGERSAIMIQNSPKNLAYKQRGDSYEIAFFYLNVSNSYHTAVARVDIPMWVARDKQAVGELHALLLTQCAMQGRNPYPYALTRADELAYVSGKDKAKLDEMIGIELRRKGIDPHRFSAKMWGKELARAPQRRHEM